MKKSVIILLVLALSGCAANQIFGGTNPEAITVKGANDPLEDTITVSTRGYQLPSFGRTHTQTGDPFFRGFKVKESGEKAYQLYTNINYPDWGYWSQIRFLSNGELIKLPANRIASDVDCHEYGCSHLEDITVDLDLNLLQEWASSKEPVSVRFTSPRFDSHVDVEINQAELKAFLSKMEEI